jgi:hypothetical protein
VSSKDLKNMMATMSMSKEEIETFLSVPRMAKLIVEMKLNLFVGQRLLSIQF